MLNASFNCKNNRADVRPRLRREHEVNCLKNIGRTRMLDAKMIGMTPAWFTRSRRDCRWPHRSANVLGSAGWGCALSLRDGHYPDHDDHELGPPGE